MAARISAESQKWRAQDDLRTLQQATEISKDRKRMAAATSEAKKQLAALSAVAKKVTKGG
jgi:hypothetical protein